MRRVISSLRFLPVVSIGRFYGGDDGGEGGAGDSGSGSVNPGGDDAAKTGITKELEGRINDIVTKTVSRQIKSFAEKQATTLEAFGTGLLEKLTGSLDEKLSAFQPATPDGKPPKGTADPAQPSAELKQMRKELDATKAALLRAEEDKAKEAKALRDAKFSSKLDEMLTGAGSNAAKLARYALAAEGRVKFRDDDSDELVFVDEDGDEVPAHKAVPEWLKSADGMRFMPATGANGSGELPNAGKGAKNGSQGAAPAPSKADLGKALLRLSQGG